MAEPLIAVHGGAGEIKRDQWSAERERAARSGLEAVLRAGYARLLEGGSASDAVVEAVCRLEDCDEFNAGRGSVLTNAGIVEMDACVMDGASRRAGAVAGVTDLRNPIHAARLVAERGPWVMLIGEGASAFARENGAKLVPPEYFVTEHRLSQLERARASGRALLDHELEHGTVGAVARDSCGQLAAATSTGGVTNKAPGRVGDSALIGAGTWADNATCAVSATGNGEIFIRCAFAKEIDALMRYTGADLRAATMSALRSVEALRGRGGCVAISAAGEITLPFTTNAMYRGVIGVDATIRVAIFRGEPV
jgi:isoaspartyl peptidase/L-asparaginase-like protein (Ntn-hydrolase superfamily)